MAIGKFDRRITIEQPTGQQDETGQPSGWETYRTCWAERVPGGGRDGFAGPEEVAETDATFKTWYDAGIRENMRVIDNGIYYSINYHQEIGRREYTLLNCSQVNEREW